MVVATGGTFDVIHKGHMALISKAIDVSNTVIIGLSSDEFACRNKKSLVNTYEQRYTNLKLFLSKFPSTSFQISKLENDFGPAVLQKDVNALIVSEETASKGDVLNKMRKDRGLQPVEIITVPMTLAEDGIIISTTRIKALEITKYGKVLSKRT